jgi:hypothetical protein
MSDLGKSTDTETKPSSTFESQDMEGMDQYKIGIHLCVVLSIL